MKEGEILYILTLNCLLDIYIKAAKCKRLNVVMTINLIAPDTQMTQKALRLSDST